MSNMDKQNTSLSDTPTGSSLSGLLCLLSCFGFFTRGFLSPFPFLFSLRFILSDEFHILPLKCINGKSLRVKNLWFCIAVWKSESLRIHLVLHGAGGCSKPSRFTIFCVVSSFFFKEVWENMNITIGPIETSFLRMTWICTRHALLFFWLNVSSFKSEFL